MPLKCPESFHCFSFPQAQIKSSQYESNDGNYKHIKNEEKKGRRPGVFLALLALPCELPRRLKAAHGSRVCAGLSLHAGQPDGPRGPALWAPVRKRRAGAAISARSPLAPSADLVLVWPLPLGACVCGLLCPGPLSYGTNRSNASMRFSCSILMVRSYRFNHL